MYLQIAIKDLEEKTKLVIVHVPVFDLAGIAHANALLNLSICGEPKVKISNVVFLENKPAYEIDAYCESLESFIKSKDLIQMFLCSESTRDLDWCVARK